MALHTYEIWVEYMDEDTGYHPVNVYLRRHGAQQAEFHGKSLRRLLNAAVNKIVADDEGGE